MQSIFGHELDGKSNVVKLSCKEIVAIFTIHVRDWILLVKTLVGLPLLKESFEIHGNEKELLYFPMFMDQNFVILS